ncbi:MoxR family ATPase [Rhodobacteraceae bacterium N5(2021)]|uniref:MoxR family ATPase n=1 Tax=Gymnodinialimonas phycosphaerae TaxID=2841589 RepID=A0A975YG65_9RHOB|nr:MoxR family ATPase [Gymnodinialimonas phycosphaerae]MBY4891353.1 MoxR family ATPase [Gymnodinialimonas phycosphaerae]
MTINATRISAGAALDVLRAAWEAQEAGKMTASWMLHGRPGVGKTEIIQQLATEIGAELFDLRLTTIEPQDLRGLPFYDHASQKTVWYRPEDLPDREAPAILFLDELTAASPSLQPTVYGLLQERRVGRHVLPDTVFIVAAGNTVDDGAVAYEMGTALSDRLVHIVVLADTEDWLKSYAPNAGIHPTVAAFLRTRPDLFETTEASLRRGEAVACTPRSWARVSDIMGLSIRRATRHVMIAGTVGEAVAAEFALMADEIAATVQVETMLDASRADRAALFPSTLHGLTALIYGIIGAVDEKRLPAAIEILNDLRSLERTGLPVSELATFGFEMLIARAMARGWQAAFATSDAYAEYARHRAAAWLP